MKEPTYADAAQSAVTRLRTRTIPECCDVSTESRTSETACAAQGDAELAECVQQRVDGVGGEADEAEERDHDDERREQREHRVVGEGGGELGELVPEDGSTERDHLVPHPRARTRPLLHRFLPARLHATAYPTPRPRAGLTRVGAPLRGYHSRDRLGRARWSDRDGGARESGPAERSAGGSGDRVLRALSASAKPAGGRSAWCCWSPWRSTCCSDSAASSCPRSSGSCWRRR